VLAAGAGAVLAHALDYLVVFPRAAARDGHLAATGHAYWPAAAGAAAIAAVLVLVAVAAAGAARARGRRWGGRGGADLPVSGLLCLQVVAFVAMEALERALVGLAPTVLLHRPEFWLGLALQLPVAWAARRLLGAVDGVAHRVAAGLARRPELPRRPARRAWRPSASRPPLSRRTACPGGPRGPPRLLAAA